MKYYSKNTKGFYSTEINGKDIPFDAVAITDAEHEALFLGQTSGKEITTDAKGKPVLTDRPSPTKEQLDERAINLAQKTLETIDLNSIRPIREYLAKLTDVPQLIKDYEAQAQSTRAELKVIKDAKA